MHKLLYGILAIAIFGITLIMWHRTRFYAVGFFMPIDRGAHTKNILFFRGTLQAWQLGIADAHAINKFEFSHQEIPANINESIPVLKEKIDKFLKAHSCWWWRDDRILIIAGFTSGQLQIAQETVNAHKRKILCASLGSTTPQAAKWPNTLQLIHNDRFAAQAITMFIRRKQYDAVAILYMKNDAYSQGYHNELSHALSEQNIPYTSVNFTPSTITHSIINSVNPFFRNTKKPVLIFTGFSPEITTAEKALDAKASIICTDTCLDLGDVFAPTREATVVLPATVDYTVNTRSVYERVFHLLEQKDSSFDYTVSYMMPFVYDFANQLGKMIVQHFDLTWRYFAVRIDAATPGAALISTWYTPQHNGPAHGGYWFIYTHDPKTKNFHTYRKMSLGNTGTLAQSAAAAYQIGYFSWAGLLGWNMYQNIWEDHYLHKKYLATKLSYDNYQTANGIINWSPSHTKIHRDKTGMWNFASDLPDQYPLEERKYELS